MHVTRSERSTVVNGYNHNNPLRSTSITMSDMSCQPLGFVFGGIHVNVGRLLHGALFLRIVHLVAQVSLELSV